jgi:hypothetical protein
VKRDPSEFFLAVPVNRENLESVSAKLLVPPVVVPIKTSLVNKKHSHLKRLHSHCLSIHRLIYSASLAQLQAISPEKIRARLVGVKTNPTTSEPLP